MLLWRAHPRSVRRSSPRSGCVFVVISKRSRRAAMRAATMFARGKRQADVAATLGVSAQTASSWFKAWSEGGRPALVGAGAPGDGHG